MARKFKRAATALLVAIMTVGFCFSAYSSDGVTYSANWFQDANGNWHIKDSQGNTVTNAWVCDDAVDRNSQNVWYLIKNGDMVSAGLVQDGTGNYYSLETNHDGYYGMLRYKNGAYNCNGVPVHLEFSQKHDGTFGTVVNTEGLAKLKELYGVTRIELDNSNIVYTSSFTNPVGVSLETPTIKEAKSIANTPIILDGYFENGYYITAFKVDPERVHIPKTVTLYSDGEGIVRKIYITNAWGPNGEKIKTIMNPTRGEVIQWVDWMSQNTPIYPIN